LIKNKVRLFEMIRESSLFVFPSFNEGMSNMLLEVASLGIPIICSDIPENMAVFDKDEVLFFKVGDKDDLAKKISFAYDNYNQMINRAIKAFEKLSNEYRWSIIASKYKETYEKLL
jgi:glycosyltransferase involved in cell wall biosynthesis